MLEFKIVIFSKAESLLGIYFDQGEFEKGDNKWHPYSRFRLGFLFISFDLIYFHKST